MRHTKQPFVVEVKRHRGRGGSSSEKNLFSLAARVEALAEPAISHPAFDAFAADPRKSVARPTGRVLPSLDEPAPAPEPAPQDDLPRRRGRPRRPTSEAAAEDAAPPRRRGRKPRLAPVGAGAASPERAQAQAQAGVVAPAPPPREKPPVAAAKARKPAPRPPEPASPAPEAVLRPEPQIAREPGEAARRRRSIMGRYVFGTELRLGERWKKRLRRGE